MSLAPERAMAKGARAARAPTVRAATSVPGGGHDRESTRALWLILLYVALVYLRPHEYVESLHEVPIIVSTLLLAFVVWLTQPLKDFSASHHRLMPALLAVMSLSVAFNGWMGGAVYAAYEFGSVLILFIMTATSRFGPPTFRTVFFVIGSVTTVLAIHGIDQSINGVGWSGATMIEGRIRYIGVLNDPNDLALAFLASLPMTLYWGRTGSFVSKMLALGAAGVQLFGIYLTNSRGAMVAMGAMLSVYSVRRFGPGRSLAVLPVLIGLAFALAPSRVLEISSEEESAAGRVEAWYQGFLMLATHPLFGVGKNNFGDHHIRTAHNSVVLVFAELGLVGYFFWLALLVVTVLMLREVIRLRPADAQGEPRADIDAYRQVAIMLGYSLGGFMVAAMFLSRSYNFLLYFLQALIVVLYLGARRRWPDEVHLVAVGRWVGAILLLEFSSIVVLYLLTKLLL